MFLITTADERTWEKDEKILFLGEWCKLYSRKDIWSKLDYETLPYHWDDGEKFSHDRNYIASVYERYLENISDRLNKIHKCNYPLRYWRILIGTWLLCFIEILFDRYVNLKIAVESFNIKSTWIINADNDNWTPRNMEQFHQFYISDAWNQYIFDEIIKHLNLFSYKQINIKNIYDNKVSRKFSLHNIKKNFEHLIVPFINKTFNSSNTVFFSSSMLGRKNQAILELGLGQFPQLIEPDLSIPHFSIDNTRLLLKPGIAKTEFEQLLEFMIPMQIPIAYWEGYKYLRKKALQLYPNNIKTIFTANSYHFNESFKVWSAENVNKGAKLVIGQHGGNMGSCLISSDQDHQIDISDQFLTWGWTKTNQPKIKPIPTIQLLRFKKNLSANKNGAILHVLGSYPRYSYIMYSAPISSQFLDYINNQIVLINHLSKSVYNLIRVRQDLSRKHKWFVKDRLIDGGHENLVDNNNMDILKTLNNCRLCIATTNSTVFLETFTGNYPTLLFWQPNHGELRPEAVPFYEMLRTCGILHDTPKSAANKLNEIYNDPINWWHQEKIQLARKTFCEQFANISKSWLQQWKSELKG